MKKMISMRLSQPTLEKLKTLSTEYEKSMTEITECAILAFFLKASEYNKLISAEKVNGSIETMLDIMSKNTSLPF